MRSLTVSLLGLVFAANSSAPLTAQAPADHVVVVSIDGLRWQEVFRGAEDDLIDPEAGGVRDRVDLRRRFTPGGGEAERREALMPFLWRTVAVRGQIFGSPDGEAACVTANPHRFSYPGYAEMLCGLVDERVDSNDRRPNPNPTVLEIIAERPGFEGRVEAFCAWDVFPFVLRESQSGVPVFAGHEPFTTDTDRTRALSALVAQLPRYWPRECFDVVPAELALAAFEREVPPRLCYVALGETDEWAHGRRYDLYLDAAHRADAFLARLWSQIQSLPDYRDRTALIVTCDHGRGETERDWTDHGAKVAGAERVWIAAMGAGVPTRGLRTDVDVTLGQTAATISALLGFAFHESVTDAAPALPLTD